MFRLWGKLIKNNKIIKDAVVSDDSSDRSRTQKVFAALEQLCHDFDLSVPIWLDSNISEFKRFSKTGFRAGNFIDSVDFDRFEIQIIEE